MLLLHGEAQLGIGQPQEALQSIGKAIAGLQWARNSIKESRSSNLPAIGLWEDGQLTPLLSLGYNHQGIALERMQAHAAAVVAFDIAERL
eukprot:SAG31_NODE_22040_length_535_cov_0.933486_1_plen_89_part_10